MRNAAVVLSALVLSFALFASWANRDSSSGPANTLLEAAFLGHGSCDFPPEGEKTFRLERAELEALAVCLYEMGDLSESGLAFVREPASDDWIAGSWSGEPGTSTLTIRTETSGATVGFATTELSARTFSGPVLLLALVLLGSLAWWRRARRR